MSKSDVALFLRRDDGQVVPFKGTIDGLKIGRVTGRQVLVENGTTEPIQVNSNRRVVKPGHHTVVHDQAVISVGGTNLIARAK